MKTVLDFDRCTLLHGDAAEIGSVLPPESVDALVCDPPAGIEFMGKAWDSFSASDANPSGPQTEEWHSNGGKNPYARSATPRYTGKGGCRNLDARDGFVQTMKAIFVEALCVLKPGAHALVWAIPRTSHWTATALEEAGFEIRDVVVHLFGTGFPKSLNLGGGFGTALKPAAEHWILCRKPLAGTVAANILQHGTGALNIDGCRIEASEGDKPLRWTHGRGMGFHGAENRGPCEASTSAGRWPANVVLDEEAAAVLDAQTADLKGGTAIQRNRDGRLKGSVALGAIRNDPRPDLGYGDAGGASRFFYVAKPSRSERDAGCGHLPPKTGGEATDREDGSAGTNSPRAGAGRTGGARNFHPTVKSIALMRWLCRLVAPPGGIVLDLFAGSGSTGVAALAEGFSFVGVEKSEEYLPITKARLLHALVDDKEDAA